MGYCQFLGWGRLADKSSEKRQELLRVERSFFQLKVLFAFLRRNAPNAGDAVRLIAAGAPVDADVRSHLRPRQPVYSTVGEAALVHEDDVPPLLNSLVDILAKMHMQEVILWGI